MGVYIGVDFHARTQSVCWCDTATGEIQERVLDHQRDDVRAFYAQFAAHSQSLLRRLNFPE